MNLAKKRLLILIAIIPLVVLTAALLYQVGMVALENQERDFWSALEFASETVTTTGYGADADWQHPIMVLFVISLQFIGLVLFYMIVPMYLIPFFEDRFEPKLPRRTAKIANHVIIYRYGAAVETLIQELTETGTPLVVIEKNESVVRRLLEQKITVIFTDETAAGLANAELGKARALIANGTDAENAGVIIAARQLDFEGELLAVVEEPYHRKPMDLAGATAVYTPRHVLGAALAARASHRISSRVSGIQQLGRKLQVAEIPVVAASELAGDTLGNSKIASRTGATIIGQWQKGHLETRIRPEMRLEPRGILVAVGSNESLTRLEGLATQGQQASRREGPFLIAGFGEVGRKVAQLLTDAGEKVRVIDLADGPGVDVVGDVLEPGVLEAARVGEAQSVILALDTDPSTLFAAVVVKNQAPEVPVIARVNEAKNVERIHHAGADFALSISQVSGQILAYRLLHQEVIAVDPQLRVLRATANRLVDRSPKDLDIRQRLDCSIVAVERGDDLIVELDSGFRFQRDDLIYVCGTHAATLRFKTEYG